MSESPKKNAENLRSLSSQHVRPLVELNDRINELTALERGINSTRIVVVGDQSHGKSSLLEALSGVMLPRGEGMKTRMPLLMKLRCLPDSEEEYAEISAEGDDTAPERIALGETAEAVERITERQAGTSSGKTILSTEIKLEVFRHQQDDLTLIDLPGITRVALDGGDGEALEKQIKQLALRYIEPAESVILNVVSAMVDLATSAAVQMSLKVDPAGERSLLCVTMVDKHRDSGLYEKINQACTDMRISGNCVFAVCNKWEDAGDGTATRADEEALLQPLKDAGMPATSLGIAELTRHLVAIQCERIKQTLPATLKDIQEKKEQLEVAAAELGEPIEARGDAHCRVTALGLIDRVTQSLRQDLEGRTTAQEDNKCSLMARVLGHCFEDRMDFISLESLNKVASESYSNGYEFHGVKVSFYTKYDPSQETFSFYTRATLPELVESIELSFTASVEDKQGNTVLQLDGTHVFAHPRSTSWGWHEFLDKNQLVKLKEGAFSLHLVGDVQDMKLKDDKAQGSSEMLCALLKKNDDSLAKDLDAICSNRFLLSSSFRSSLSKRAAERQGCVGLPGTVSQEVPLNAIRDLVGKLPSIFEHYCSSVHSTVLTVVTDTLKEIIPKDKFPCLERVLKKKATEIMAEQQKATAKSVKQILRWEDNVHTSNHYYMSTVQSIRKSLFDSPSAEKSGESNDKVADETFADHARDRCVQMMGISAKRVKLMSNVEQEVVDLQIKVFAYWKTMKKRILDYVQMATRSELAVEPICNMFCTCFREAIEKHSMTALMTPNADLSRRRCDIHRRLQSLNTAEELIHEKMSENPCLFTSSNAM